MPKLPACWHPWLQVLGQLYNQTTHGPLKELKQAVAGTLLVAPSVLPVKARRRSMVGIAQRAQACPCRHHCCHLWYCCSAELLALLMMLVRSWLAGTPAPLLPADRLTVGDMREMEERFTGLFTTMGEVRCSCP